MSYVKHYVVTLTGIKLRMPYPRLFGGLLGFLYGSTSTGPTYLEGEHVHLYCILAKAEMTNIDCICSLRCTGTRMKATLCKETA
jgi:hypothetical protein